MVVHAVYSIFKRDGALYYDYDSDVVRWRSNKEINAIYCTRRAALKTEYIG